MAAIARSIILPSPWKSKRNFNHKFQSAAFRSLCIPKIQCRRRPLKANCNPPTPTPISDSSSNNSPVPSPSPSPLNFFRKILRFVRCCIMWVILLWFWKINYVADNFVLVLDVFWKNSLSLFPCDSDWKIPLTLSYAFYKSIIMPALKFQVPCLLWRLVEQEKEKKDGEKTDGEKKESVPIVTRICVPPSSTKKCFKVKVVVIEDDDDGDIEDD